MVGLIIRQDACDLDFLSLGALVHRLDPVLGHIADQQFDRVCADVDDGAAAGGHVPGH